MGPKPLAVGPPDRAGLAVDYRLVGVGRLVGVCAEVVRGWRIAALDVGDEGGAGGGAGHRGGSFSLKTNVLRFVLSCNTKTHHLHQIGEYLIRWGMSKETEPVARKTVTLPVSLWAEISIFRHGQRIGTEAEALRRLIQAGLRAEELREARRVRK